MFFSTIYGVFTIEWEEESLKTNQNSRYGCSDTFFAVLKKVVSLHRETVKKK